MRSLGYPCLTAFATFAIATGVQAEKRVESSSPTPVSVVSSEDLELSGLQSADDFLKTMVTDGKVSLNLRGRIELADQDGLETSQAYTLRTRLGFTTGVYNGFHGHIEMIDVRAADESLYNAAGLNGEPTKTVIADPEDTRLNQFYADYKLDDLDGNIRIGRQRIKLDDDRFIGNVGWRQIEQTFDAARVNIAPNEQLSVTYAYIWDVNRIFGPDADRDYESDSHVINLSYDDARLGKITGFGYLLDFDDEATADDNSSDTFGVRYEASRPVKGDPDGPKVNYLFSYATQSDAGNNPDNYDADYFLADVKYITETGCYIGAGWEKLGSDNGMAAFRTPLATGHKFNGWADVFLTTPDDGLEDTYVYVGGNLPHGYKAKAAYHWFDPDEGSSDFGEEFDAILTKKVSDNMELQAKYAYYHGADTFADRAKFWLQVTLNY